MSARKNEKILHIRVLEGKDLIGLDNRGKSSDPYVIVTVNDASKRTTTIKKDVNPNWTEIEPDPFKFPIDPKNPPDYITFEIFDWNKFASHKRMGIVAVSTSDLYEDGRLVGSIERWFPVQKVKESDHVSGELKVSISFGESTGADQLFNAIKKSDLRRLHELLELRERRPQEVDVNAKDEFGYTPLHAACCIFSEDDDAILTELLRQESIDVTVENQDRNTPLHYFCEKFRSPNCTEAFEMFMKKGADVNIQNKNGETPLHKAIFNNSVRILMVNLLVKHKADVNKQSTGGETPLHYAVHLGREDLVTILLKAGADITIKGGRDNQVPYDLSLKENHQKIATLIARAKEVFDWFDSIGGLDQYKTSFLQQDITKDLIPRLEEKDLDRMGVTTQGHRLKIMKAVKSLREAHQEHTPPAPAVVKEAPPAPSDEKSDLQKELEKLVKYSNRTDGVCNIHHSELEFTVKLGAGAAGVVYKGLYKGQDVAIKVLKTEQASKELEEFKKEFQIMGTIQSPYTVFFFGACLSPKLCMVMEFCSRGSLYDVMNDKKLDLTWEHVFSFSKEMVLGMDCLHNGTPSIVHRDFKSLNLMVNEQFHVKVGDFGLSRFNTETQKETLAKMRGTFAYCAPEVYFGNQFSTKSDVFSIGVVLWELVTRMLKNVYERPYQEYPNLRFDFQIIIQTAKNKLRPTIKDTCPESFVELIKQCWSHEAAERPTCQEVSEKLNAIEAEYKANKEAWNAACEGPSNNNNV